MAKRFTGIGVVVVLAAIGGLGALGACNSSSDSTGDCSTLETCCAQVTDASEKSSCMTIVSEGDATTCGTIQSEYEQNSLCKVTTVSTGGGGGCAGLTTCCGSLSAALQPTCDQEVSLSGGADSMCSTYLQAYQNAGMCASVGTGTGTGGTGCAGLSTCCGSLPSADQSGCDTIVSEGVDSTCSTDLSAYEAAGLCSAGTGTGTGTGGTGCAALSTCCASAPAADQSSCDAIVSEGSDTTCSAELTSFMAAGLCGGGAGSGTGTSGTGCASLSTCCASVPAADQSSCDAIVSEGSDTTCSEELTAYTNAGLCG
jgi:hypothetical protein